MTPTESYDVVVLGAGVTGLSIALALAKAGVRIAVAARELPTDLDSAGFASPWAGANWSSFATTPAERARDAATYAAWGALERTHPHIVRRWPFVYVWRTDAGYSTPWYKDSVHDFRALEPAELPSSFTGGVTFRSFCLHPHRYLGYLSSELAALGVPLLRARVSSLAEASTLFGSPARLVVNATALGSRSLLGVEDASVRPARGQTVLVCAPGVQTCFGVRDADLPPGQSSYIIPRPGEGDHVILGGTFGLDDYSTLPDPATAERILRDAYALCPALSNGTGWENILVVAHNVGLRPFRDGGLRLELETVKVGGPLTPGLKEEREVRVLHAYGIGPAGYQASVGIADEARDLVLADLERK
ncbi:hypothetical protein Q5752_000516 [Cryptotrichosporon argae]